MIQRAQSSGDIWLDLVVDEKVSEELQIDALEGPFKSLDQVSANGTPVVVPRHGIWEMHGGQEETCRLIDDMLVSGHNDTAGTEFTHIPADVDRVAGKTRYVQERFQSRTVVFCV